MQNKKDPFYTPWGCDSCKNYCKTFNLQNGKLTNAYKSYCSLGFNSTELDHKGCFRYIKSDSPISSCEKEIKSISILLNVEQQLNQIQLQLNELLPYIKTDDNK